LRNVYSPDGVNLGMNIGRAAGAGVAGHVHMHVLPRWVGDTNFMTTVAESRVLPEALEETYQRIKEAVERS
jgi:ATP adenylyltransferase